MARHARRTPAPPSSRRIVRHVSRTYPRRAGNATAYGYDAGGERVVKANARRWTVYLPGGADLQQTFGGGGVTSSTWTLSVGDDAGVLVRLQRTDVPGQVPLTLARLALSDLLRSVTVEVDDSGNLLGFEQYTPYGDSCVRVVVSGAAGYSTSKYRFNGKERDVEETGLYYYGARYYACWIGRWVSCDPSVDVRGSAYGFCAGNPTSLVDLDGRAPEAAEAVGLPMESGARTSASNHELQSTLAAADATAQREAAYRARLASLPPASSNEAQMFANRHGTGVVLPRGGSLAEARQRDRYLAVKEAGPTMTSGPLQAGVTAIVAARTGDWVKAQAAGQLAGIAGLIGGAKGAAVVNSLVKSGGGRAMVPRQGRAVAGERPPEASKGGRGTTGFIDDVTVTSHGKVIGRGTVDVRGTAEGIRTGKITPRDIFQNREGLLPSKPPGYYQEFVHPTPGVKGVGPQRIIQGQGGELFYTPDHYKSFIPLN